MDMLWFFAVSESDFAFPKILKPKNRANEYRFENKMAN